MKTMRVSKPDQTWKMGEMTRSSWPRRDNRPANAGTVAEAPIVGEDRADAIPQPRPADWDRVIGRLADTSAMTDATPLRHWPACERPRERLLQQGAAALSNAELLAILLRTGSRGQSAVALAKQLLNANDSSLTRLLSMEPSRLMRLHGLGPARATTLAVVIELARRVSTEQLRQSTVLDNPAAVHDYLALTLRAQTREVFMVLFLNNQHCLIQTDVLFTGTLNQTAVYPREVLKRAIELNAAAVILAHNHPSGHPEPSAADRTLTRKLQQLLGEVDIRVLDHIIVAASQQFSFLRQGLL